MYQILRLKHFIKDVKKLEDFARNNNNLENIIDNRNIDHFNNEILLGFQSKFCVYFVSIAASFVVWLFCILWFLTPESVLVWYVCILAFCLFFFLKRLSKKAS